MRSKPHTHARTHAHTHTHDKLKQDRGETPDSDALLSEAAGLPKAVKTLCNKAAARRPGYGQKYEQRSGRAPSPGRLVPTDKEEQLAWVYFGLVSGVKRAGTAMLET